VKLLGEGADDAGGVFDDTISEMCCELVSPASGLRLLVPTPNAIADIGFNRDKFVFNPEKTSDQDLRHVWFMGTLKSQFIGLRKQTD
jgi:E3 ubiquitin-protein ligase HERC1